MDGMKDLISKRLKQAKPNVKLHSEAHQLADEISTVFGEKPRFAMYLGVIKRVGVPQARRIFQELRQEGKGHLGKLFMFLCGKKAKERDAAARAAAEQSKP
jgi:hypothetical protein